MRGWVFRGQRDHTWGLKTSLERLAGPNDAPRRIVVEERILNRFMRQARQHLPFVPHKHDYLAWLSYIQHHGGPTRLLDFTRSFYVAASPCAGRFTTVLSPRDVRFALKCPVNTLHPGIVPQHGAIRKRETGSLS
jgi:hypothetical protein